MQRPGRAGKNEDRFLLVKVVMIAANGPGRCRRDVYIGDAPDEVERLRGRGKTEAARIPVIRQF